GESPASAGASAGAGRALARHHAGAGRGRGGRRRALPGHAEPVTARFTFLSGARVGQVETFRKAYIGLGRHPLSDVRFDPERDLARSPPAPRRSSTAVRIAVEVARQTRQLRLTTKILIGVFAVVLAAFGWLQWTARRDARELARLQTRADSLSLAAQALLSR